MNIKEFFDLSAGKWFSHRTSHHLAFQQFEDGKSDIVVEILATDRPEVIKLCQRYEISPSSAACSAKVTWNEIMEGNQKKDSGSSVLVSIPDVDNPNEGKFLQEIGSTKETSIIGRYKIGSDGALTLTTEYENVSAEERLWFASPNLRMRVRVLKRSDGFSTASFTSEIRMGGIPSTKKVSETANSAAS
ncbi:phycobiliprotein lyase [Nostocaceae cyanobacterium CENA369]|uniref:Chromophore lyase CpcS/CpeS n=1 Tax=Dendronalium phyllosphericum CENA369 TaxID=1725256 RepID=A0A8J7I837_9NOST|nr:phycobiliprotein lyase [Dendronalium phyllosphericum]MBH8575958.1 phycobiliprotein lyase [Dendronalium phyllosphericum CENA369]